MKLKDFLKGLNTFVKENPDSLEMEVITSKDDEGNGYNRVYYEPSKGLFEDSDFTSESQFEEMEWDEATSNAVCLN